MTLSLQSCWEACEAVDIVPVPMYEHTCCLTIGSWASNEYVSLVQLSQPRPSSVLTSMLLAPLEPSEKATRLSALSKEESSGTPPLCECLRASLDLTDPF